MEKTIREKDRYILQKETKKEGSLNIGERNKEMRIAKYWRSHKERRIAKYWRSHKERRIAKNWRSHTERRIAKYLGKPQREKDS